MSGHRPEHVPQERVVDFDFFNIKPVDGDIHRGWKKLHDGPEIFWTPHNGGHWVATRAVDLEEMYKNYELFSSHHMAIPVAGMSDLPIHPVDADPPVHTAYRNLMAPAFTPKVVNGLGVKARSLTVSLIESFYARGSCEFVLDFSKHMPIGIFLTMTGLPEEDAKMLLPLIDAKTRNADPQVQLDVWNQVVAYVEGKVKLRREQPGDDILTRFVQGKINGELISHRHAVGMSVLAMFAGLDTIVASLGFVIRFLALNPGHRKQLIDEPALIPDAVEELLRRFSVVSDARMITKDINYKGVSFRKGDMILLPTMLHGLDERRFPDPLTVDFKRADKFHLAFGAGVHRCIGSLLARTELRVLLEEWLPRIPDFSIDPGREVICQAGQTTAILQLPLVWEPKRAKLAA